MTIEQKIAEKMQNSYGEKKANKLDQLISLDRKVHRPAEITAYTVGIIGSLILGLGMCLAMKVIMDMMALGIVIGVVGIFIVSVNYFLYKKILKSRKKKYASQILALSNEILGK